MAPEKASKVILRGTSPKNYQLWNKALAEQGPPTLNRASRRNTAKVIAARDRKRKKEQNG